MSLISGLCRQNETMRARSVQWHRCDLLPRFSCHGELSRVRFQSGGRRDYNEERPHSALGNLTPAEFAMQFRQGLYPMATEQEATLPTDPTN